MSVTNSEHSHDQDALPRHFCLSWSPADGDSVCSLWVINGRGLGTTDSIQGHRGSEPRHWNQDLRIQLDSRSQRHLLQHADAHWNTCNVERNSPQFVYELRNLTPICLWIVPRMLCVKTLLVYLNNLKCCTLHVLRDNLPPIFLLYCQMGF